MPISADQSAVLEMLLTGGQSFEDLDDLFGVDEGETFQRARSALEELGGADPDRNVGLTEYLLGQADPIGRADAVRHLRQDATDRELADTIVTELTALYPAAELPKLPQAPAGSRFGGRQSPAPRLSPPASPCRMKDGRRRLHFEADAADRRPGRRGNPPDRHRPRDRGRLLGRRRAGSATTSADAETGETAGDPLDPSTPIPDGTEVSRIALTPPGGGNAGGGAVVAVTDTGQPYIDLVLSNLPEAPEGQAFLAWFMFNKDNGYPLAAEITPQKNGTFEGRFPIPLEAGEILQFAQAIEISLSDPEEIVKEAEAAFAEESPEIVRPGRDDPRWRNSASEPLREKRTSRRPARPAAQDNG